MPELICPYSAILAHKSAFSCPNADEVIRRGGSEYICMPPGNYELCSDVYDKVKIAYLDSKDLKDDLLSLPHSTFVKIQFGCILGLQSSLGRDITTINDMGSLITDAVSQYINTDGLPFERLNENISSHKLQKRGKRK